MEVALVVLSFVLAMVGILGAIYPIIPGALVSFGALLLFFFSGNDALALSTLIIWGVVVLVVSVVDSIIPPLITSKMGGSKKATWGSAIGVIIGSFFFPPLGMILGAFLGALIGEFLETSRLGSKEFRIAMGSFFGFILGTGLKLIVSIMILIVLIFKML